jgi:hypothetical protein
MAWICHECHAAVDAIVRLRVVGQSSSAQYANATPLQLCARCSRQVHCQVCEREFADNAAVVPLYGCSGYIHELGGCT